MGAGPRVGVAADGFFWAKIFVLQLQPSQFQHLFIISVCSFFTF